ncbi:SPOSA6832_02508, partial [Sporobolomyces salmonicolor]
MPASGVPAGPPPDFQHLPSDYQSLGHGYQQQAYTPKGLVGLESPPLVPAGLPDVAKGLMDRAQPYPTPLSHGATFSPSMQSVSSTTTYSTPTLSSEGMSLTSSHDTLASAPYFASAPSPQVYVAAASPANDPYYRDIALHDGQGLGLQHMYPSGASDPKGKARRAEELAAPPRSQARRPPPDISRKGEDIGLSLGDFDMLDTLGTGTFGKVLLARLRTSPIRPAQTQVHYFAMKVLEKSTVVRLRQVEHVNSERSTLALIQHPFVVNLFCTFQDEQNLYLLLEYVQGGELFSHLRRAGRFSADVARFYIANLVLALEHLHEHDIIYRDLKPENLLIDATGHIKVTDFGFAKYVPDRTYTLCGTPEYLAPEIITATGHGAAADWWALGVLLFELLAGYPPFFADNPLEIYEKILTGKFGVPHHIDPVAKDLIRRLLTADLTKRLGNLKNGAQDVKNHQWFEGVDWDAVKRKEIRVRSVSAGGGEGDGRRLICLDLDLQAPIIPLTHVPGDSSNFERFPATSIAREYARRASSDVAAQ